MGSTSARRPRALSSSFPFLLASLWRVLTRGGGSGAGSQSVCLPLCPCSSGACESRLEVPGQHSRRFRKAGT